VESKIFREDEIQEEAYFEAFKKWKLGGYSSILENLKAYQNQVKKETTHMNKAKSTIFEKYRQIQENFQQDVLRGEETEAEVSSGVILQNIQNRQPREHSGQRRKQMMPSHQEVQSFQAGVYQSIKSSQQKELLQRKQSPRPP